jgi:hypothetical protein
LLFGNKKIFMVLAWYRTVARQNGFFARVAAADSAVRISVETMHRCTRAHQ